MRFQSIPMPAALHHMTCISVVCFWPGMSTRQHIVLKGGPDCANSGAVFNGDLLSAMGFSSADAVDLSEK